MRHHLQFPIGGLSCSASILYGVTQQDTPSGPLRPATRITQHLGVLHDIHFNWLSSDDAGWHHNRFSWVSPGLRKVHWLTLMRTVMRRVIFLEHITQSRIRGPALQLCLVHYIRVLEHIRLRHPLEWEIGGRELRETGGNILRMGTLEMARFADVLRRIPRPSR